MEDRKISRLKRASSSRDALMDSALQMIERDGVLAGLNVSEVAKDVGVTPANVYHFFGSRQNLLRKAIVHALDEIRDVVESEIPACEQPRRMFQAISQNPQVRLWALLAMDGDPELIPTPSPQSPRKSGGSNGSSQGLDGEAIDVEMLSHLLLVGSVGYAIFRKATAAELDCSVEELDQRAEQVFARMAEFALPDAEPEERAASEG